MQDVREAASICVESSLDAFSLIHQFTTQELLEKPSQEELDDLDKQMQEMQETLSQMKDKNHQLTLGILK